MIGFEEVPVSERSRPGEGDDTKNLSKKAFYNMLNLKYYMPPVTARGVTRDYLLKVHRDQVFRVDQVELRQFEVNLTPAMNKRVGLLNNCFLVRKVNVLLRSREQPELGFDEYDPPDENWLYKIVRFLDPTNILEFFEAPVQPEPPFVHGVSNVIQGVHHGRIIASQYFFLLETVKKDRKMWESLKTLAINYRAYLSHMMLVDKMNYELGIANAKCQEFLRLMEDQISKIAFTYSMVQTPGLRSDMIINGSQDLTQEMRKDIDFNCRL
jgi:hypothetical protein